MKLFFSGETVKDPTRKPAFRIGMPVILLVQLLLILMLVLFSSEIIFL